MKAEIIHGELFLRARAKTINGLFTRAFSLNKYGIQVHDALKRLYYHGYGKVLA